MRPLGPLLRLSPTVAAPSASRARRRRPAGLVVAFGLAVVVVGPVAGSPPPARTDDAGEGAPAVPVPRRGADPASVPLLAPPPGTTTVISLTAEDGFATLPSTSPSISENGRWVAFVSVAPDLVAGDQNNAQDVFLRDRRAGTTVRIPLPGGAAPPAGGTALDPAISADGSVVAFTYIPPPPTTSIAVPCVAPRVLVWNRETGATELASINADDGLHCNAFAPSVSGDGRYVAFVGVVVLDEGIGISQIFVRDRNAATTTLASAGTIVGAAGATGIGNGNSREPSISRDGAIVAFESDATNLLPGDLNQRTDVYLRILGENRTELISAVDGGQANGNSLNPAVSANGSIVAFESDAPNLVPGVTPTARSVYAHDRASGQTEIISKAADGSPAPGISGLSAISGDGRVVAYASVVPDLVAAAGARLAAAVLPPIPTEVYAHDRVTDETIRISEARGGGPAGLINIQPTIGGDGRYVAFASNSGNLARGDGNQVSDVFLRELPPVPRIAPDPVDFGARALGAAGPPIAAVVTNDGWSPLTVRGVDRSGPAAADFTIAFNGCDGRVIRRTESCPVTITFAPGAAGERNATLAVDHNGARPPATVALHGSGSNATVELEPPVGRPGIVTIVTGAGFPPDTELTLSWSRGLTPKTPAVRTGRDGTFRVQMLVFHNDLIGRRDLIVGPARGATFAPFGTAFLVVEPASEPPRFEPGEPSANRQPTLVFRD
ncbi:MAG TPA: choice-of-anchor D domain-containing protein [Candidatus Limnocylindrales bacterium]|nr:choice-of-anchor D domain-containing protein [Candidatus Limnocylindrales bacterium]